MVKRTVVERIDDLDGGPAVETVRFGVDGVQYEIDLSEVNAVELRRVFARYVGAGSRVGRSVLAGGRSSSVRCGVSDPGRNRAIREWAGSRGISVPARGRVPGRVVALFEADQSR